jgi:hypothetical protein
MYLKAALFLVIGISSAMLLFANEPTLRTAALIALMIWSFCRLYYFAFHVIERYIDPSFRYSGLLSIARDHFRRKQRVIGSGR